MSYYGWILLLSFIFPFALSFDRKIAYYKNWSHLLWPLALVSTAFIVWDHLFTWQGVWGFSPQYVFGSYFGELPIEEVLFFVVVPYNCVFILEVLKGYFTIEDKPSFNRFMLFGLIILAGALIVWNPKGWYTLSACSASILICLCFLWAKPKWTTLFLLTFLVSFVPFLIVNGLLTGAATEVPVVWYSPIHHVPLRIWTIPVEDVFYNFDLLSGVVALYYWSKRKTLNLA